LILETPSWSKRAKRKAEIQAKWAEQMNDPEVVERREYYRALREKKYAERAAMDSEK